MKRSIHQSINPRAFLLTPRASSARGTTPFRPVYAPGLRASRGQRADEALPHGARGADDQDRHGGAVPDRPVFVAPVRKDRYGRSGVGAK